MGELFQQATLLHLLFSNKAEKNKSDGVAFYMPGVHRVTVNHSLSKNVDALQCWTKQTTQLLATREAVSKERGLGHALSIEECLTIAVCRYCRPKRQLGEWVKLKLAVTVAYDSEWCAA